MIEALERYSHSKTNYVAGFVTSLVVCVFCLVRGFILATEEPVLLVLAVLIGYFYYEFLEYVIHRWIFHGNWLPKDNALSRGHAAHHENITDTISQPFFFQILIGLAHWLVISIVAPQDLVSFVIFGFFLGYLYYGIIHHVMHMGIKSKSKYFRHLTAYHVLHHKHPEANFGVCARMWDVLFGTAYRRDSVS